MNAKQVYKEVKQAMRQWFYLAEKSDGDDYSLWLNANYTAKVLSGLENARRDAVKFTEIACSYFHADPSPVCEAAPF